MSALKWLLMLLGAAVFGSAGALVAYDVYLSEQLRRLLSRNRTDESGADLKAPAKRSRIRNPFSLRVNILGGSAGQVSASQYPCGWPGARSSRAERSCAQRQAPPRLTLLARGRSSSGDAFRATRLAVKNCRKGSQAELGFKCQGNDHEDRDKNYK